ncbi:AcrR family transcriptional regulator [Bradyrhizobium sp. USDA 3315]
MQMRESRKEAVSRHKRELILDAARSVFAEEGLEGASLRAIATRAGYTAAALYFHFDSKEAIYAEVLRQSLASLGEAVSAAVATTRGAKQKLHAAGMGFFRYYAEHPARPRSRLLFVPRRHEAGRARP